MKRLKFKHSYSDKRHLQWNAEIRTYEIWIKLKFGGAQFCFQTVLSVQNPNCAYLHAIFTLAPPVDYVVEFGFQTTVQNPEVYKLDASRLFKIQTGSDFGCSLYLLNTVNVRKRENVKIGTF